MSLPTRVNRSRRAVTVTAWVAIACMLTGVAALITCGVLDASGWWRTSALALTIGGLCAPFVAGGIAARAQRDVADEAVVPDGEELVLTDDEIEASERLKITD